MMYLRMDAFDAYKKYLALKSHFTSDSYDFFKYNGAVRAKRDTFDRRKDKYFFQKLAKHKDLTNFLVALFVYGKPDAWVGDMVRNEESEQMYTAWKRVNESITQTFRNDLDEMDDDFKSNFVVKNGQHPPLLKLLLRGKIHIETFIILNDLVRFSGLWNKSISDTLVWPDVRKKCKKYQPFLQYDKERCKQILVNHFDLE